MNTLFGVYFDQSSNDLQGSTIPYHTARLGRQKHSLLSNDSVMTFPPLQEKDPSH